MVDKLQSVLRAAGFEVWRDKDPLFRGDDWATKIREAIQGGPLVVKVSENSSGLRSRRF